VLNLALFAVVTMDLHWNTPDTGSLPGTPVRLLSYNIKALNARHKPGGLDEIETEVRRHQPDIVALQDAQKWLTDSSSHTVEKVRPVFGLPHVVAFDQYVLASRYPLQDCKADSLGEGEDAADYLQCTVLLESGPVQLVTTHLVSPRHSLLATKNNLTEGLDAWRLNVAERMLQSQALLSALSRMPRPLILMGDFNSAEQSPAIANLKRAGLHDAFSEAGRGWGYTHGHALRLALDIYRIDHILLSADITARTANVGDSDASEHNAVIADVLIRP
jgi:endonuclease/exonuclease/phosphatase family metal-dependent hydrolase